MNNFDEKIEEEQTIQVMTPKEIKKKILPEFQNNPDKYYPVKTLTNLGFQRYNCKNCKKFFWSTNERNICGDSNCVGSYKFIEKKVSNLDKKITYEEAWKSFEKSLTTARIPCTSIKRYPTVARWRNDVDYVAAGIYCFQPFCVTGEMDPPANPLICPQFCLRFNDLDNIGLTGRHYSGFIMNGIQVFNYENDFKFFKEECVEFNFNWLTQELKINKDEIIFMEDVWCGGGNLGPCIEYFIGGLELGNMVFMEFKTFHDGSFEDLPIKVIDVGIGLERIPWLINGSPNSYFDVFKTPYKYLTDNLDIDEQKEIWNKIGPKTCELDVDENDDIQKTWKEISESLNMEVDEIKKKITPMRELFILLDHTRSILMLITDGALPSNVGGGSNLRNILRRTFAIMKKNKWMDKLGFDGYLKIFELHKSDLSEIYGPFEEYKSFNEIIKIEYERWSNTDDSTKSKLNKLLKKKKNKLDIEDWYIGVTSWGLPADTISDISGIPVPDNLYYLISERQAKSAKKPEQILYNTSNLEATKELLYENDKLFTFEAKITAIFQNIQDNNRRNILILNQSLFYPTSGGQANDTGIIEIKNKKYIVKNVEKVGKCILHILENDLEDDINVDNIIIGNVDLERRIQLRNHHTATHIIFASCRQVLGPHVWQHGAKKTILNAHLDITHYSSITYEVEKQIERAANEIILKNLDISKSYMPKELAEKDYGFRLYQGGIVPGNTLRVVNIENTDVEACCGTHCDSTGEVGWIKIIASKRIADGIVRLYYVAGKRTIEKLEEQSDLVSNLISLWKVPQNEIYQTADRIFKDYKKLKNDNTANTKSIMNLQVKYLTNTNCNKVMINSIEESPTIYFSYLNNYLEPIRSKEKCISFLGETFIYVIVSNENQFNATEIEEILKTENCQFEKKSKTKTLKSKNKMFENVFMMKSKFNKKLILENLTKQGFELLE